MWTKALGQDVCDVLEGEVTVLVSKFVIYNFQSIHISEEKYGLHSTV